jgi:hypothetical protein
MKFGRSLMGRGTGSYGNEIRGEGLGAFLTTASALYLSTSRAFIGKLSDNRNHASWNIERLAATYKNGKIILSGRILANPPLTGIIAYNEYANFPESKTWATKSDSNGNFHIEIDELERTSYQLRVVGVHESGQTNRFVINYTVYASGPDIAFDVSVPSAELKRAFLDNREQAGNIIGKMTATTKYPSNDAHRETIPPLTTEEQVETNKYITEYGRVAIVAYLIDVDENSDADLILKYVKYFLSQGADINAKDGGGNTPLHNAAAMIDAVEVLKFLISKGADVHAKANNGATSLHYAARYNHNIEIAQLLVSKGALVDASDNKDKTPLDWAKEHGNVAVIEYLTGLE